MVSGPQAESWQEALLDFRRRKDDHFRSGRGPLLTTALATFTGLSYYPPDPTWNLTLDVQRVPSEPVEVTTTTPGQVQHFMTWGQVTLPSGEHLSLYVPQGSTQPHSAFVPFRDATSGQETYGAGRYLDAPLAGDTVNLDFNRAYQPYCAYSDAWTCPLPPAANWLIAAVRAGEKTAVSG